MHERQNYSLFMLEAELEQIEAEARNYIKHKVVEEILYPGRNVGTVVFDLFLPQTLMQTILQDVIDSQYTKQIKNGWKVKTKCNSVDRLLGGIRILAIKTKQNVNDGCFKLREDVDIKITYKNQILRIQFRVQRENKYGDLQYS